MEAARTRFCPAALLDDSSPLTSLQMDVGYDPDTGEGVALADVLAGDAEDPAQAAARNLDWEALMDSPGRPGTEDDRRIRAGGLDAKREICGWIERFRDERQEAQAGGRNEGVLRAGVFGGCGADSGMDGGCGGSEGKGELPEDRGAM